MGRDHPARPYRSKRLRPCDVCRRRKAACRLEGEAPCSNCRLLSTECTFNDPPTKRQRPRRTQEHDSPQIQESLSQEPSLHSPNPLPSHPHDFQGLPQFQPSTIWPSHDGFERISFDPEGLFTIDESMEQLLPDPVLDGAESNLLASASQETSPQHLWQLNLSHPLHDSDDISAQYLGLSGYMDPYLLRQLNYEDGGLCNPFKGQYRFVGSEARGNPSTIPVQFMFSTDSIAHKSVMNSLTPDPEIQTMVPLEIGARLVGLFLRYVFPSLPVVSRSRLGLQSEMLIPQFSSLQTMPVYLLAAMYASAVPFHHHDPVLCVYNSRAKLPVGSLWEIAYGGIEKHSQNALLPVLQTTLLYLQMSPPKTSSAITPSHQSMLQNVVSLATSLGLHLDCNSWTIPAWEKRLRRRLWWIVYSECTWRSLFLGFPHPISQDEWDVEPLTEGDFAIDSLNCPNEESMRRKPEQQKPCLFCHGGRDFKYLSGLTSVARDIYVEFYTLAATKTHAHNIESSRLAGCALLKRLNEWQESLPANLRVDANYQPEEKTSSFHSSSGAYLRLTFLALEVLVYRAMRRPIDTTLGDCTTIPPADSTLSITFESVKGLHQVLSFTEKLSVYDRGSFWYSWACIAFATISSFIMLSLVQAPSAPMAKEVKEILDRWTRILRSQCVTFDQMQLALVRLDAMIWSSPGKSFHCPPYVQELLEE